MATTYSLLYFHLVFSTKYRKPWISQTIEEEVWKNIAGIAKGIDCTAIAVGGIEDHLHTLFTSAPKYKPSDIVSKLKSNSSRFIHESFRGLSTFSWQEGYGLFTVSESVVPAVVDYIKNQRVRHEKQTFEEEYRELLRLHGLGGGDDRYMFG